MVLAAALARLVVTQRQLRVLVQVGSQRVALASLALFRVAGPLDGQSVPEKTRLAPFTVRTVRIVDAPGKKTTCKCSCW